MRSYIAFKVRLCWCAIEPSKLQKLGDDSGITVYLLTTVMQGDNALTAMTLFEKFGSHSQKSYLFKIHFSNISPRWHIAAICHTPCQSLMKENGWYMMVSRTITDITATRIFRCTMEKMGVTSRVSLGSRLKRDGNSAQKPRQHQAFWLQPLLRCCRQRAKMSWVVSRLVVAASDAARKIGYAISKFSWLEHLL